ncbi:MAG: glycosyltransferase family 4 protein [Sandaracinaceae bacterium]|nr:glycosyltransferase family 4 protein [Sandaracinaceae bacterium]
MGRLIDALGARVSDLTVALSVAPQAQPLHEHALTLKPGRFVGMPGMPSVVRGFHKFKDCADAIHEVERQSDVTIIQLPFAATLALQRPAGPRVYHVCADQRASMRVNRSYRGATHIAAVAAAEIIDALTRVLIARKDARIVTHGFELLHHYGEKSGRSVVSSSLLASEIGSVKRVRPKGAPFRVLFVGYLRPEKGIDVLLRAFGQFLKNEPNAELCIVGTRDLDDHGFGVKFDRDVQALGAGDKVSFLGHKGFGPQLFQCYADADVVVVPSRSEGTPRVLVEARAFGTPVIGTEVGGIPASITHGVDGLLIPADDADALTESLLRIAVDDALRGQLIQNGYDRARRCTVEAFSEAILGEAVLARAQARSIQRGTSHASNGS